jgi:hypothetical protein
MSIRHDNLGHSGRALAALGVFVERAAHAANPSRSKLGRAAAIVTLARLGAHLLPAGWRIARRYPLASTIAVSGILLALYATRPHAIRPPRASTLH